MKEKAFILGILLFCFWKFYYNFVDVVPSWLNDSYFTVESFLLVIIVYSSTWNKEIRLVGLFATIGSFLYFLLRYIDIFQFNPIGAKYFVPSFITFGILIVGIQSWRHYR